MRNVLMASLLSGVFGGAFYLLQAVFLQPHVPRWLHALGFGVMFGVVSACGGWAASALGWARPEPRWPLILGGTAAGVALAIFRWLQDRRAREA